MTELDLYKYINGNSIEWHRQDNDGTPDILIFPYIFQLEEFCELIKYYDNDNGGLLVYIKNGYAAIWMNDICEYFGIDPANVFIDQ